MPSRTTVVGFGLTAALALGGAMPPVRANAVTNRANDPGVIFSDDFASATASAAEGWALGESDSGTAEVSGGGLVLTTSGEQDTSIPVRHRGGTQITADISLLGDKPEYRSADIWCEGMGLGADDSLLPGYTVEIDGAGDVYLTKTVGPVGNVDYQYPGDGQYPVRGDEPLHVTLDCVPHPHATAISLWIDDHLTMTYTDRRRPLAGSGIGLAVHDDSLEVNAKGKLRSGSHTVSARFSNLVVRALGDDSPASKDSTSPSPPARGPVLYRNALGEADGSFRDRQADDWSSFHFAGGAYVGTVTRPEYTGWHLAGDLTALTDRPKRSTTDVTVAATKLAGGGSDYGLVCDGVGGAIGVGYFLGIDEDGTAVIRLGSPGKPSSDSISIVVAAGTSAAIKPGSAVNHLRAVCATRPDGSVHLVLAVNGRAVLDTTDDTFVGDPVDAGGEAGIYVRSDLGPSVSVGFRDFVVRGQA